MNRRHARPAAALAAAMLLSAACASLRVNSYQVRHLDARQYRTYAWDISGVEPTGDPRLDNNRFFDERVRRAVEAEMTRRGFERPAENTPADLLVRYHANVKQQIDASRLDRQYSPGLDAESMVTVFDAGTLVVDFVDARTKSLVWRGWAEGTLEGVIDDQRALERRIDEAIARMLRRLPRSL